MSTKRKTLPKGIAAGQFDKAIKELKVILGEENVLVDETRLAPYNKIMMPVPNEQHAPSAANTRVKWFTRSVWRENSWPRQSPATAKSMLPVRRAIPSSSRLDRP